MLDGSTVARLEGWIVGLALGRLVGRVVGYLDYYQKGDQISDRSWHIQEADIVTCSCLRICIMMAMCYPCHLYHG
jgi:hypothetical protein